MHFFSFQAMSAQILGGSILMRVIAKSKNNYILTQTFISNSFSGTISVLMEILLKSLAKLVFCGTRHSLHVIGLPMFNVLPNQQQSQLQLLDLW